MSDIASLSPLDRLLVQPGVIRITSDAPGTGTAVLFFTGISKGRKDASDVAVALSEVIKPYGGRITVGVVANAIEDAMRERFGVRVLPALIFVKDGTLMRGLFGIKDWAVYVEAFRSHFGAP